MMIIYYYGFEIPLFQCVWLKLYPQTQTLSLRPYPSLLLYLTLSLKTKNTHTHEGVCSDNSSTYPFNQALSFKEPTRAHPDV